MRSLLDGGDDTAESSNTEAKKVTKDDPLYPLELCKEFKRTLCHENVRAHFVGVWYARISIVPHMTVY